MEKFKEVLCMKNKTEIRTRKKKCKEEPVVVVEGTPPKKQKIEKTTENRTTWSVYRQKRAEKQKEELYKKLQDPSADTEPVDETPKIH